MEITPKIRILWIDDRERVSGYPQKQLPSRLAQWFEVAHPASAEAAVMSYESAAAFSKAFTPFWFEKKTRLFPAEIIAADYNLQKVAAADSGPQPRRSLVPSTDQAGRAQDQTTITDRATRSVTFDGLLIGVFYATITYRHPAALVSITNYPGSMPSEVHTLRELTTPFLSVATQQGAAIDAAGTSIWHNLPATERSWENIVAAALDPLRRRIAFLYRHGHIVIPPADLTRVLDGATDGTVKIKSSLAYRVLPLQGLFCDFEDDKQRAVEMSAWAAKLLECRVTREQYEKATKLACTIWSKYNNDALLEAHARFSSLHFADPVGDEYGELKSTFGLIQTKRGKEGEFECTERCFDIRSGTYSRDERRWAALILMRRLLKRVLLFMEETKVRSVSRDGQVRDQSLYPEFEEDDVLLLLFPVPTSPFPLPWHIRDAKLRDNKKGGWRGWLKRNLGFKPKDLLEGRGLTSGERQILQGMVMDEDDEFGPSPAQRLERWRTYEPASLFLFVSQTSVE